MKEPASEPLNLARAPAPLSSYDQGFVDGYLAARGATGGSEVECLTALEVLDHLRDDTAAKR